jgi:hypothetical protein
MSPDLKELKNYADYTFFTEGKKYTIAGDGLFADLNVQGKPTKRLIEELRGIPKPVVFNSTSWHRCAEAWGSLTEKWKGKEVTAHILNAMIGGREVTYVVFSPA